MPRPNSSEIIFVVDRSGSMSTIADDMRGAFAELIKKQREEPTAPETRVTLARFDDRYELVYAARPLSEVPPLDLEPRGFTALLDAVGKTINDVGGRFAKTPEADRPAKVLFVIITDGQENSSREFSRQRVFDMISHQRTKYSWEFIFLGASQDAISVAEGMGILAANAAVYSNTRVGSRRMVGAVSNVLRSYQKGVSLNVQDEVNNVAVDDDGSTT